MPSPFQLYQARVKKQQDAKHLADVEPYSPAKASTSLFNSKKKYDLMLAALTVDCKTLKDLPTLEARRHLKANELIPKYEGYIQEYRASGHYFNNEVQGWFLVWLFDCNYFTAGLDLAQFMVNNKQAMPECFNGKTVQTFVTDFIKDWGEAEQKAGRPIEPYVSELLALLKSPAWVIHEQLNAKLLKVKGLDLLSNGDYAGAVDFLSQAQTLYKEVGVKTKLDLAKKELAKQPLINGESTPTGDATASAEPLDEQLDEPSQANTAGETTTP